MTQEEKQALAEKIGKETTDAIAKVGKGMDEAAEKVAKQVLEKGGVTKENFETYQSKTAEALEAVKEIAIKQGLTMQELQLKAMGAPEKGVSLSESMFQNKDAIKGTLKSGGNVEFMIYTDKDGNNKAMRVEKNDTDGYQPFANKAAGPNATVDGLGVNGGSGTGNLASVISNLSSASILRMGTDAPIENIYRNSTFLFDQLNLINAGMEQNRAIWWDEISDPSVAAVVAEGQPKPFDQYKFKMNSSDYRVAAHALEFSNQFAMDFPRIEAQIMQNGTMDLMNRINSLVLPNVIAAATAYTAANGISFSGGPGNVTNVNDYDAIVALATQAKNNSFGAAPNAALMSTYKEGRIAVLKDTQGRYLNQPSYLDNVRMSGNPLISADDLIVGDLKQYNIILRGGMIVRIGLNGNNLIENKFTVVQEQLFFDYISQARKVALLKGPTFAAVKALI